MNNKMLKGFLLVLIALGIFASGYLGWQRNEIEKSNRQVDLTVDWAQVKELARRQGLPEEAVLQKLQGTVSGIVFKELTVSDLVNNGTVLINTGTEMLWEASEDNNYQIHQNWTYLISSDAEILTGIEQALRIKQMIPEGNMETFTRKTGQGEAYILALSLSPQDFSKLGVGFDANSLKLADAMGFNLVPQFRTWKFVDQESLDSVFQPFAGLSLGAVCFNDENLPGIGLAGSKQKEAFELLTEQIDALKVPVGMVEFFPQKGMTELARLVDGNVVRLHAIREDEMSAMTQTKAVDRFVLAATDRNIRILLVRFFPDMNLEETAAYLEDIKVSLADEGLSLGQPKTMAALPYSPALLLIIALAVASGGVLLLCLLGYEKTGVVLGALGLLGTAALLAVGQVGLARKGLALISVIIYPTLSITYFLGTKPRNLGGALLQFTKTSMVSLIGAVLMVGLLGEKSFMYTLDQFMGVKLAHLIPIMLLVVIFWFLKDKNEDYIKKIVRVLNHPLMIKYLIVLGFLAVILLVYITRTGNDNTSVSVWELAFRAKLEALLAVRPRTKEFLIGHPIMLLLFYLGYRDSYLPLLLVGAIGQISMVNTFAHIHTPIMISLLRTVNGLWLGILIGIILILVIKVAVKLFDKQIEYLKRTGD